MILYETQFTTTVDGKESRFTVFIHAQDIDQARKKAQDILLNFRYQTTYQIRTDDKEENISILKNILDIAETPLLQRLEGMLRYDQYEFGEGDTVKILRDCSGRYKDDIVVLELDAGELTTRNCSCRDNWELVKAKQDFKIGDKVTINPYTDTRQPSEICAGIVNENTFNGVTHVLWTNGILDAQSDLILISKLK